jgi:hypothetical protein
MKKAVYIRVNRITASRTERIQNGNTTVNKMMKTFTNPLGRFVWAALYAGKTFVGFTFLNAIRRPACAGLVFLLFAASAAQAQTQTALPEGTWALDSVQVKEIIPQGQIEKTISGNERWKFDHCWMKTFSAGEREGVIRCSMATGETTDALYRAMPENSYLIEFMELGFMQTFILQFFPDDRLELIAEYSGTYQMQPIQGTFKFFYHKTAKP